MTSNPKNCLEINQKEITKFKSIYSDCSAVQDETPSNPIRLSEKENLNASNRGGKFNDSRKQESDKEWS